MTRRRNCWRRSGWASSFLEFKEVQLAGKEPAIGQFDNAELRLTIHAARSEPER